MTYLNRDIKLNFLIRGNNANEDSDKKTDWQSRTSNNLSQDSTPSIEAVPKLGIEGGFSAGSKAICKSNQKLLDEVKQNMKRSEDLRNRIAGKRKGIS